MKAAYYQFSPSDRCKSIIEEIWVQDSPEDPSADPTTILPDGRVELVIHYGDPFVLMTDTGPTTMSAGHIVGQQHQPISASATGITGIVIVRFYPWSASALIPQPLAEFTDSFVDIADVWPADVVAQLQEDIHAASTPLQRAAVADRFVCARSAVEEPDRACRATIDLMNEDWGRGRIDAIAARLGLSRRQLGRRFSTGTGISPKKMSRLLRAQKATTCIRNGLDIHDVIGRCGYVDQSHLIHDVVNHTGKRPSELAVREHSRLQQFFNAPDADGFCGLAYL
jgi:AraC-like DNA-binding protein